MTRRLLFLLPIAAVLRADSARDIQQSITDAVSGLSAGKPEEFLAVFDSSMPGYDQLQTSLRALMARADLSCSLEVMSNEGDDSARTLTLDWILRMDGKEMSAGSTRRHRTVKCQWHKIGKKWRIVSFEPLDLFAL